ncbi:MULTISPECIES: nitroreductase family protein [Arthrobacter]|nr:MULTISPECIES: nitroreductase family protein [Arthrobacter]MBT8163493.1 nitroreductase family protein [Arthrobacter sp. GN70]
MSVWTDLSRRRHSARSFTGEPIPGESLGDLLAVMATALPVDIPNSMQEHPLVSVSLLLVDKTSCELDVPSVRTQFVPDGTGTEHFVRACMGQRHVGAAKAFLLFHANTNQLLGTGGDGHNIREALFRSGAAAHLAYLGAAQNHLGIFTIGGFVQTIWKDLAALPATEELLCLMAIGVEQSETRTRADRELRADAHGEA